MKKITLLVVLFVATHWAMSQCMIDTAVNFSVKDIYGNNIELFPILDEGKLVVIDFYSTSCGPCALYAPDIQASYEDFGENTSNVHFISIDYGDDNAGVEYFDSLYSISIPSVSGSQGGGKDVHNTYMIQSTPNVIIIAPDRVIVEHFIWEPTQENLNAAIIAAGGSMVGVDETGERASDDLKIYPNPSSGRLNIELEVDEASLFRMETYNILGTRVHRGPEVYLSPGSNILRVDLTGLPEGTYLLRLLKDGKPYKLSRAVLFN